MKNAMQIINTLQNKPQFSKLLESKCITKLKSSLLISIQHNIKYGYINNGVLNFVLTTKLNKFDVDNIINTIKMILNSPMILESNNFLECLHTKIDDIRVYTNPKPIQKIQLFTTLSHTQKYKERATGEIDLSIKDKKLQQITKKIFTIIKERKLTTFNK